MDAGFWRKKWEENKIAFHESAPNPLLVKHLKKLSLAEGGRIFIPLCGKTLDIAWLLSQGYRVAGAELSEIAVEQLFAGLGVRPEISALADGQHYSAENIDIFLGDIFTLSAQALGPIDAVYDRAALVALPKEMRARYAAHMLEITGTAPQLLICYEYDQAALSGPPFSVSDGEVTGHYGKSHRLILLAEENLAGGLKGCPAAEKVWLLKAA